MTASAAPVAQPDALRGVGLIVAGMAILTLNDALMKLLVAGLPLGQAVAMRGTAGCVMMLLVARWTGGWRALLPRSYGKITVLSTLMLMMLFLFPWSLQRMPLADGIMLVSTSPVLAACLAPWLLAEKVGWRRWSAVVLGLIGTALVLDPGGGGLNWAMPVVLFCALLVAVRDILTQRYITGESALSMVFMANVFAVVGGAATLPFWAEVPTPDQYGLALATGVLVTVAMAMLTAAFHYAGAVVISCLKYAGIIWAALFGWLFWGELLTWQGWAGAALITVSGVIISVRSGR